MDLLKRKRKKERRRAIAAEAVSKVKAAAGLPVPKKLPPKYRSNGPLADRLTRALARNEPKRDRKEKSLGAGKPLPFVYARRTVSEDFDVVDNSRRRATWSKRVAFRARVQEASLRDMADRRDATKCKERPEDSRRGGGGPARAFVPWCKK